MRDNTPVIVMDEAVEIYLNLFKNYFIETGQLYSDMIKRPILLINSTPDATEGTVQILSRQNVLPSVIVEENLASYRVAENLKARYGSQQNKIICLKDILRVNSIEDLIPFEAFGESCGKILIDTFGADFVLRSSIPFLDQITPTATNNIPADLRVQLARNLSAWVMRNQKDRRIKSASKAWLKLFEAIYQK